jgi:polyisoprenoid-binding protein YceI
VNSEQLAVKASRVSAWLLVAAAVLGAARQEEVRPLRYRLENAGSSVRWELPATMHTVRGVVPKFEGWIHADPSAEGWDVRSRIVVAAASMHTGSGKRDRTMREKVLETDQHPEIVFELKSFRADLARFRAGQAFTVQIAGDLTVHGRKQTVQLPVDVHVFPKAAVITGSFPLHWKEYGLHDPSFGLVKVKDPMMVHFRLRAVPEE